MSLTFGKQDIQNQKYWSQKTRDLQSSKNTEYPFTSMVHFYTSMVQFLWSMVHQYEIMVHPSTGMVHRYTKYGVLSTSMVHPNTSMVNYLHVWCTPNISMVNYLQVWCIDKWVLYIIYTYNAPQYTSMVYNL